MLFSGNTFAALLAVAAVAVAGSPVELVKRGDSIGSARWCGGNGQCASNVWIEPDTPTSPHCYGTGNADFFGYFHIYPKGGSSPSNRMSCIYYS
jgi:hypothetical protein